MANRMTVTEYARYRKKRGLPGGSRYGVQKALRDGRIAKESDGKIDPKKADRDWDANTSEAKRRQDVPTPSTYQEARAIREALNARIRRLEYEEKLGQLVQASEVRKEAFEMGRRLRDRFLAIPGRVAAEIAAENDARRVEEKLAAEFRQALEDVAG